MPCKVRVKKGLRKRGIQEATENKPCNSEIMRNQQQCLTARISSPVRDIPGSINVQCAAGKGAFGTDEIKKHVAQVKILVDV